MRIPLPIAPARTVSQAPRETLFRVCSPSAAITFALRGAQRALASGDVGFGVDGKKTE